LAFSLPAEQVLWQAGHLDFNCHLGFDIWNFARAGLPRRALMALSARLAMTLPFPSLREAEGEEAIS
jgi:hypothetical protein